MEPTNRFAGTPAAKLLVAAVLVAILGLASVVALNAWVYTPQRTIEGYFDALTSGDAATARGYLQAPDPQPGSAITDDSLRQAASLPTQLRITDVARTGDTATVTASYALGNMKKETTFSLVRTGADWAGFRSWAIRLQAWPALRLQVSGASIAEVGGVAVPTARDVPVFFPASYSIGFNATYLKSKTQRVDVTDPTAAVRATLTPEPTEALRTEVAAIVRQQLDACARQNTLMPAGCSFGYTTNNTVLGKVGWKISQYPDIRLQAEGAKLIIVSSTVGADLSVRMRDSVTAYESQVDEPVTAPFTATVEVRGSTVSVVQDTGQSLGSE